MYKKEEKKKKLGMDVVFEEPVGYSCRGVRQAVVNEYLKLE